MEQQGPDDPASPEVARLLTERDALTRRLTGIDQQLEALYAHRQEDLSRRLTSIEDAIRELSRQGDAARVVPAPAATLAPAATPAATAPPPAAPAPLATAVSAAAPPSTPAAAAPVDPAAAQPAAVAPSAPAAARIIGERVSVDALTLWSGPEPGARNLGWLPQGTRLLLTDVAHGHRVQVMYLNRLMWADRAWLEQVPAQAERPRVTTSAPTRPAPGPAAPAPSLPAAGSTPAPAHPSTASPALAAPASGAATPAAQPAGPGSRAPVPPVPLSRPPATVRPWERPGFVAKVLALVGAAVTLIGVGFLLVLAAQYGLFGPGARTISAALLGVALVVLAFVVRRRDPRNVGAPILAATGVAAGFLAVVTATAIYHWLPPLVGAGLTAFIGLGGMWLARSWANQWVALISVLGSLGLAAWVGSAEPVATVGLMVLMTGVTLWFERGTDWRLFPFARVLPTVFLLLQIITAPEALSGAEAWWIAGLSVAVALLGLLSAVIAPTDPPAGQAIALGLLVPMVIPAAMIPFLLQNPMAAAVPLGVVAVAFGVAGFVPRVDARVRWALVPIGALFILLAVFTITEQRYIGVLTPAMGTAYLAVASRTRSAVNFVVGGALAVAGLIAWVPQLATLLSQRAAEAAGPEQILQSLVGIAAIVLAFLAARRWIGATEPWMTYLAWALAILMGSVAVILLGTWIGGHAGNSAAGYQTGQALVTSAWMVLCAVFLRRGLAARQNEDVWLRLALAISTLAVAKLFLLDLGVLDAIARVGAFLAVGLLLLFVGTRYARAWERAHGDSAVDAGSPAAPEASSPAAPAIATDVPEPAAAAPRPPESKAP